MIILTQKQVQENQTTFTTRQSIECIYKYINLLIKDTNKLATIKQMKSE